MCVCNVPLFPRIFHSIEITSKTQKAEFLSNYIFNCKTTEEIKIKQKTSDLTKISKIGRLTKKLDKRQKKDPQSGELVGQGKENGDVESAPPQTATNKQTHTKKTDALSAVFNSG